MFDIKAAPFFYSLELQANSFHRGLQRSTSSVCKGQRISHVIPCDLYLYLEILNESELDFELQGRNACGKFGHRKTWQVINRENQGMIVCG